MLGRLSGAAGVRPGRGPAAGVSFCPSGGDCIWAWDRLTRGSMDPRVLERMSEMGPVAHLVALLCLFVVVLLRVWRTKREAFWPAVTTGLIGMLIGGGVLLAGSRILGLKVLKPSEYRRLERRAAYREQSQPWMARRRSSPTYEQGKVGLVVLVRRLEAITENAPGFLNDRQAGGVISLLEMVLPMPGYSEKEAGEMVADLSRRFDQEQMEAIRAAAIPDDLDMRGPGGWLANPLQGEINRAAVLALIKRYERVGRTVLTPRMLDL